METLDISGALEIVCPMALYSGSLTANNEASYDLLTWSDPREKPAWSAINTCMTTCSDINCYDWSGSSWLINTIDSKEFIKSKMKTIKESFCCSGAMVTVTVLGIDYSGIFCPEDRGLESASGVASYRAGVDDTKPPVPMGPVWYVKDDSGADIEIPMTEALITDIQIAVKNWYTECGRVYKERKIAMLKMEDVSDFDPIADMQAYLPSRNITVS